MSSPATTTDARLSAVKWFSKWYVSQASADAKLAPVVGTDDDDNEITYDHAKKDFAERQAWWASERDRTAARYKEGGIPFDDARFDAEIAEAVRVRPTAMLSPGTWSFRQGANHIFWTRTLPGQFDDRSLLNVVIMSESGILPSFLCRLGKSQLLSHAEDILESEKGDHPIQTQPFTYLCQGVLVAENWQWLSDADLTKWFIAVTGDACTILGTHNERLKAVRRILREQVRMLEEMVDLRWTADADARGHNVLLELLRDNRRTLGQLPTAKRSAADTPTDEPNAKACKTEK
jgi:hypothetical protein